MFRIVRIVLLALFTLAAGAAFAQASPDKEAEHKAAVAAAEAAAINGPASVPLRDQAALKLPKGYSFVPMPAAGRLLQAMGNRSDDTLVGAVFPDRENWFAVVRFVKEGYIKDDDAREWNADDLLKSLREGTEAGNEERTKRGFSAIEVEGWAEKPRYEASTHRLVWSATTRAKGSAARDDLGVNYNTYALGRDGYISLNLVTALNELDKHKPVALELLAALEYNDGKRYADFDSSTDKVAAYGLAALVAGAAAKKLGLLAVMLAFAAKFSKVLIVAAGAMIWGIARFFKKKPAEQPHAATAQPSPPAEPAPPLDPRPPTS